MHRDFLIALYYFLWHHFYSQYYQQAICYCMPWKWQRAGWHVGGREKKGKQTNQYSNQFSVEMYTMTHKMLRVPLINQDSFGTICSSRSPYTVGAVGWPEFPQSWRSGKWWGIIRETKVSSRKSRTALAAWPGTKSASVTLPLLICASPPHPKNYFLFWQSTCVYLISYDMTATTVMMHSQYSWQLK